VPWPASIPYTEQKGFHYHRIINTGGALSRLEGATESMREKVIRYFASLYFWLRFPAWVWKNTCYAPNLKDFPNRISLLFKKLLSAKSRAKI